MTVHVYCGPTITPAEVLEIIPDASVHPPIRHGDLLRLAVGPGDTVVIIDGLFHAVAAVRHKEILDLLARGVRVLGAASMGALRAAELYPYGMTGIGDIFAAYRDGIIEADDEVAVAHTDDGRQLSEALADIRALVADAVTGGVLDRGEAERIIGHARRIPYTERTWLALRKVSSPDPGTEALLVRLNAWRAVRGPAQSAKHADAVAALRLAAGGKLPQPPVGDWVSGPWHTFYLRHWIARYRGRAIDGIYVPYLAVLQHQQIYDPGFHERWRKHVLSWIAALLAPAGQGKGLDAQVRALAAAEAPGPARLLAHRRRVRQTGRHREVGAPPGAHGVPRSVGGGLAYGVRRCPGTDQSRDRQPWGGRHRVPSQRPGRSLGSGAYGFRVASWPAACSPRKSLGCRSGR
jgi:hypothetical protein